MIAYGKCDKCYNLLYVIISYSLYCKKKFKFQTMAPNIEFITPWGKSSQSSDINSASLNARVDEMINTVLESSSGEVCERNKNKINKGPRKRVKKQSKDMNTPAPKINKYIVDPMLKLPTNENVNSETLTLMRITV